MKKLIALMVFALIVAILPISALAGQYQALLTGSVDPEISLHTTLNSGALAVKHQYYWAGDGISVPANEAGPTLGAMEIITANIPTTLSMQLNTRWACCKSGVNLINGEIVTIYFDKDTQFGNSNEFELPKDGKFTDGCGCTPNWGVYESSWVSVANEAEPMNQGDKIYLAVRADDYGPMNLGGLWRIPIEISAKAV